MTSINSYSVVGNGPYSLVRHIGNRTLVLVSDTNQEKIKEFHQKIVSDVYPSEKELFEDIYREYKGRSILA